MFGADSSSVLVTSSEYSVRVSDYRFLLHVMAMTVSSFGTLAVDGWAVTFGTRWQFWNTC